MLEFIEEIDKEVPSDDSASLGEKMILYWLIRELRPETVLETGTHKGLATLYMAQALYDNNKGIIHTFDPFDWGQLGNFRKFPKLEERIRFYKKKGEESEVVDIDFAFIDGFHEKDVVVREIQNIFPFLNKNAVVVFHDCWEGNTDGVNEACEEADLRTLWLPTTNAIRIYINKKNA